MLHLQGGSRAGEPRYAWDQTPEEVQLYIFHDSIGELWRMDDASCLLKIGNESVVYSFCEENGAEWSLDLLLFAGIDPVASHYKVRRDRISVKLSKSCPGAIWPTLRRVDVLTLDDFPPMPESFKTPKDACDDNDAQVSIRKENGATWESMGESDKISVMAAERRTLENLLEAAKRGDVEDITHQVEAIARAHSLAASDVLNSYLDGNKRGVAHIAASTGQSDVLSWALRSGADLSQPDVYGQTPFSIAAANGHVRSVQMLAAHMDVGVDSQDFSTNATALHHAAGNGDGAMVRHFTL